jgi:hypothetical protein
MEIRLAAWKVWTIAGAVVVSTALVTSLVVGHWRTPAPSPVAPVSPAKAGDASKQQAPSAASAPAGQSAARTPSAPAEQRAARTPSRSDVKACNQVAEKVAQEEKTKDVVTKAVVGGLVGAGVGAAGGAIADGGKGAGKGAAIGGIVGVTAGTLYGLSAENSKNPRSKQAYVGCMRERGYSG